MQTHKPSVLIVGATGNLGSQLCTTFVKKGWRVSGTHRSDADGERLTRQGVRAYKVDVTDRYSLESMAHQMSSHDTLVMNSGILSGRSRQHFLEVNAHGPQQTFSVLGQHGQLPSRVIHVSSQLVGGDLERPGLRYVLGGLQAVDPDHAQEVMSFYAQSKALGELYAAQEFYKTHGTYDGFVSLRPAGILGLDDKVTTKPMASGLKGIKLFGIYPNFTREAFPQISVIRDHDLATVIEHVARENLEALCFGVFDVENGEEGLYLQEVVAAGQQAFGTQTVFTPRLPFIFRMAAGAQEFLRIFGQATVLDRSRVPELQNPNLGTTNERLFAAFPDLSGIQMQTLKEIFKATLSERSREH